LTAWANEKGISANLISSSGYNFFSDSNYTQNFRNDFLLPLAGRRESSSAALTLTGTDGYFWSSSPYSPYVRNLHVNPPSVFISSYHGRAVGFSVRCFKNAISPAPSILSVSYNPAQETWTTGNVIVTVTLNQNGVTLADWSLNEKVFTKTFTDNWA
jgi:hypothetical protein